MKKRIGGIVFAVWGAAIIIFKLTSTAAPSGNKAYDAGQTGGLVLGGFFLVVGLIYTIKSFKKTDNASDSEADA